jgi:hypothetical protein
MGLLGGTLIERYRSFAGSKAGGLMEVIIFGLAWAAIYALVLYAFYFGVLYILLSAQC